MAKAKTSTTKLSSAQQNSFSNNIGSANIITTD